MSNREKLPRWDCRNEREQKEFEDWTIRQLRLLDEPTADDIQHDFENFSDNAHIEAVVRAAGERLLRGRIVGAIEDGDHRRVLQLTADRVDLLRFAVTRAMFMLKPPGRGRKVGESRPADMSDEERWILQDASEDVERIKRIWKSFFGKYYRSDRNPPTALQLAARHNRITEKKLANWRKNQSRRRR